MGELRACAPWGEGKIPAAGEVRQGGRHGRRSSCALGEKGSALGCFCRKLGVEWRNEAENGDGALAPVIYRRRPRAPLVAWPAAAGWLVPGIGQEPGVQRLAEEGGGHPLAEGAASCKWPRLQCARISFEQLTATTNRKRKRVVAEIQKLR
jgi:hypothetical protein